MSSHGRGRFVAEVSMFIGSRSVVGGNLDVHAQDAIGVRPLLKGDVLENQELRRRLEIVNEAPDVLVLSGQRRRDRELAEAAVALRLRIELTVDERHVGRLGELLEFQERDAAGGTL